MNIRDLVSLGERYFKLTGMNFSKSTTLDDAVRLVRKLELERDVEILETYIYYLNGERIEFGF